MAVQRKISLKKYNDIMDKIIKKDLSVVDTLVAMLEEASKYSIVEVSRKKAGTKNGN